MVVRETISTIAFPIVDLTLVREHTLQRYRHNSKTDDENGMSLFSDESEDNLSIPLFCGWSGCNPLI